MATKLNQIIAVEKGLKARTLAAVTKVYHDLQKGQLYAGLHRRYRPVDDEGETFPEESTLVQRHVMDDLYGAENRLAQLFDVVATKDVANMTAKAAVVIEGTEVIPAMPVSYLLFVEKQLDHLRTVVSAVPVLDPAERWIPPGQATSDWTTPPVITTRTRKVPKVLVKYPATEQHPAQTEVYTSDEVVGHWETTRSSGAVPAGDRQAILDRIDELSRAIKQAVEEANQAEVEQQHIGYKVFEFIDPTV